jgi:hypothetical protein
MAAGGLGRNYCEILAVKGLRKVDRNNRLLQKGVLLVMIIND